MKGGTKEKRLAAQFIPKFFKHFPELADSAINAQLDLCEDEDVSVSLWLKLRKSFYIFLLLFPHIFLLILNSLKVPVVLVHSKTSHCGKCRNKMAFEKTHSSCNTFKCGKSIVKNKSKYSGWRDSIKVLAWHKTNRILISQHIFTGTTRRDF